MAAPKPYKLPGRWPIRNRFPVDPEVLRSIRELCDRARYFEAWGLAETIGPLAGWAGVEARLIGSFVANHSGAARLSDLLDVSAFREAPNDPEAQLTYLDFLRSRRSPLDAWNLLCRVETDSQPGAIRGRFLAAKAGIAISFRDFDSARQWLRRAAEARPELAWNELQRARLLFAEDRYEEALEAAQVPLGVDRYRRSALDLIVEALKCLNREDEAVVLLTDSFARLQCPWLVQQLVGIRREHEDFAGMIEPLALFEKWSPALEPRGWRWLCGSRAEAFCYCGRLEEAAIWAERAGTDYHLAFAARLRDPAAPRLRVRLPVAFVRQHHHTCAPATLAALASFYGLPASQREIVEEICYDGTYDLHERRWAEENACFVREFRVTWEAAKDLIDRGIPFAMVTSAPGSSHLQAVIGYDEMRATLLIREPSDREYNEFDAEVFFQRHAPVGPRGMAFVPLARRELLAGADLPEAALYDDCFALNVALDSHNREEALRLCEKLERTAPGARLAIVARRVLADYDRNAPQQLAAINALLERFPGDQRLELARISCLQDLARREERLQLLIELSLQSEIHPIFWKELAVELAQDAREFDRASRYLLRAHRGASWLASAVSKMADIAWDRQQIPEEIQLYRFAFCCDDKNENAARSYFIASRHVHEAEAALLFLRHRFEIYGAKSSGPARTLFRSLDDLDRVHEALEVLEEAIRRRPGDGMLMLFAADQFTRYNRGERATELLAAAKIVSRGASWLRTAARLAANRGAHAEALGYGRQVVELEPLAEDAHGELARLLAQTEGRGQALEHLRATCERFPHNFDLRRLWLSKLREDSEAGAEPVARLLVEFHPSHAWARREHASILCKLGRLDEASVEAELARLLDPTAGSAYNVIGAIEVRRGQFDRAREAFRQAIRLEVDNRYAIEGLVEHAPSAEEKRRDLAFVRSELVRQVVFGSGLIAYQEVAQSVLNPDELLLALREALDARPDLWSSWSALTRQLLSSGCLEEAEAKALEITRRFPLTAGSWRTLGQVYARRHDWRAALAATEKALEIDPAWISAVCDCSDLCERAGEPSRGRELVASALARYPNEARLHAYLADWIWPLGQEAVALDHLRRAVQLDPGYGWAWDKLREWGDGGETLRLARELAETRPGEARSWFILAESLSKADQAGEKLGALDRALALNPQFADAADLKASVLCDQKRFDESLAACRPAAWGCQPPATLRARAAWVEARRGNRREAIRQMRAVLAETEDYFWGRCRLVDWLDEDKDFPEALIAAEALVRWSPKSAVSYGYRGQARLNVGDRYGAIADFHRALDLDARYGFAARELFDLQLEDDDFAAAEKTLGFIHQGSVKDAALAAEVRLCLRSGRIQAAIDAFRILASLEEAERRAFDGLVDEFESAHALVSLDDALESLVSAAALNASAAAIWVGRQTRKGHWDLLPAIQGFMAEEGMARGAVNAWFRAVGAAKRRLPRLSELFSDHRKWLQAESVTWGLLGYALNEARQFRLVVKWLADWPSRDDVAPWMLTNLSLSLRAIGQHAVAANVSHWVVERNGDDYATATHQCLHALDEALAGRIDAARKAMAASGVKELNARERFVADLATGVIEVHTAPGRDKRAVFHGVMDRLRRSALKFKEAETDLVCILPHPVRRMAASAGFWFPWRYGLRLRKRFFSQ